MKEFKGLLFKKLKRFFGIVASIANHSLDYVIGTLNLDLVILAFLLKAKFSRDLISAVYFFVIDEILLIF